MKKLLAASFLSFLGAIITGIVLIRSHKSNEAIRMLLSGEGGLSKIEIHGQQKSFKIKEPSVPADFETAFKNPRGQLGVSGIAYEMVFVLKNGTRVKADIHLNIDKTGFIFHDYSRLGAGDPKSEVIEFSHKLSNPTKDLVDSLLN